jgi:hypothetical protein
MFLGAANRHPRQWERPDDYDIGRRTIGHVSGIHQCVGQLLARMEGKSVVGARPQSRGNRDYRPDPPARTGRAPDSNTPYNRLNSRLGCQLKIGPELDGLTVHLPDRQS